MKVRIRFEKILSDCGGYVLFRIAGKCVRISRKEFIFGKKNTIIAERETADKYKLKWKLLFHIPAPIAPEYNQKCIDELRF